MKSETIILWSEMMQCSDQEVVSFPEALLIFFVCVCIFSARTCVDKGFDHLHITIC